ncbi:MAG TPA: EAL domain-containing protein [Acidimicrobiales bacterium]|nr:EAL domain-containing protein [Acidimicrobiales bacterium]
MSTSGPDGCRTVVTRDGDLSISWQSLLEAMPDGTALIDGHGVMHCVNEELTLITGYDRDELVGENVLVLIPPELRAMEEEARRRFAQDPDSRIIWNDRELTVLCKDGTERSVDFALSPLVVGDARWTMGSIRDNSVQRAAEQARSEAEQHFRMAFEDNMAPMVFTDLRDCIIAANDAFCTMVGRSRSELIGFDSKPFTYPDDIGIAEASHERFLHGEIRQVRYVKRYLHSDGRMIVAEVSKSPARDKTGKTLYFIISERDITEERLLTAQLSHQALHDPLTGLANRALLDDRLAQAHSRIIRQDGHGALFLLDLDDFKGVNDTYGHLVGDQLLEAVARRLEVVARATDTLCRFGGDEFLYLAEGITGSHEAELIAGRFLRSLDEPFSVGDLSLEQRASLGAVVWDSSTTDISDVVRDADVALYEAKRLGKGRHFVYVPGMQDQLVNRFSLVQELRTAVASGDLAMHYQPIVRLSTNEVIGFEALMRWHHAERGWVPPSEFIPLAEQSDLILDLGAFALHESIMAAAEWGRTKDSLSEPYVTVNLSARQFHHPGLLELVKKELEVCSLPADRLIIEITESVALMETADTVKMIQQLTDLGIGVALDDFGTGFSSLSYLALLNPMIIKIDQSFIRPVMKTIHSDRLLETIVLLGHNLGMTMSAEGIETQDQLENLRELHCSLGQGYLFSPAVAFDVAATMVGTSFSF